MAETRIAETTVPTLGRVRSMLFMPGNLAEMIAKIPRFAPDVAVADLEDAAAAPDGCAAVGVVVPKPEIVDRAGPGPRRARADGPCRPSPSRTCPS